MTTAKAKVSVFGAPDGSMAMEACSMILTLAGPMASISPTG